MSKGFLMLAQNNKSDDYVKQACLNAMSIKATNADALVSLVTNDEVPKKYKKLFDKIIPIPYGDAAVDSEWKVENRWKLYHVSPYDETVVMDTDMIVLQDISTWWKFLSNYDLFFVNNVYTYRDEVVTSDFYRKTFTANDLPNIYVGFHYFKKSELAYKFYYWLELIVNNWELFYGQYAPNEYPNRQSIDVSSAIAVKILNCEHFVTNKNTKFPSFTHMKPSIQNWYETPLRWQNRVDAYISKDCKIKIGNHSQTGILHYTEKDFADDVIMQRYEEYLNV